MTSVDRDDLDDRGAEHLARTIRALRRRLPDAGVEVLTPDFLGLEEQALEMVLAAHPDVFNHNIETVRRIQPRVRLKGDYDRALWLLRRAREDWEERFAERGPLVVKSGIVAGMGETDDEIVATLADLRGHGVDVVTIGQYLQPTEKHLPLDRWVRSTPSGASARPGEADGLRLGLRRAPGALVLPRRGAAPAATGELRAGALYRGGARRPAPVPRPGGAADRRRSAGAMTPSVWRPGCPVALSRTYLRRVTLTYVGFDGRSHTGRAGRQPHGRRARWRARSASCTPRASPIRRMVPIEAYRGSDFDSIEADNTSAFNCRSATGSAHWLEHAYGRAIDLDPIENPYVSGRQHEPPRLAPLRRPRPRARAGPA